MKMRLLVDGDGTGDDRRMNMLLKLLIKWCNTDEVDTASCEMNYQRMLGQLANIEWNMSKSRLVAEMNEAEMNNYELIQSKIETGIEAAKKEIQDTKVELVEAKGIRKNRLEYDALAKVIEKHPDRVSSLARLQSLDDEQKALREKELALEEKLATRKKQFNLLISTLHQLQTLVEDEDGVVKPGSHEDTSQELTEAVEVMDTDTVVDLD